MKGMRSDPFALSRCRRSSNADGSNGKSETGCCELGTRGGKRVTSKPLYCLGPIRCQAQKSRLGGGLIKNIAYADFGGATCFKEPFLIARSIFAKASLRRSAFIFCKSLMVSLSVTMPISLGEVYG